MAGVVVVGVGGDGSGGQAAQVAARLAEPLGATLVLVFGYEASPLGPRGGPLEEQIEAVGQEAVDAVVADVVTAHPDLAVQVELVRMRPVEALIAVAEEHDALAIVVGHGGEGPMKAALLGSITYEVVHRAPRPVLVVPNDGDDEVADGGRRTADGGRLTADG